MDKSGIDLIWNSEDTGTAESATAGELSVGGREGWNAEELLSVAVQADLMSRFLGLAGERKLTVLGYVSAVNLVTPPAPDNQFEVMLRPCVVLADPGDEPAARELMNAARKESPVCNSLTRVHLESTFVVGREERR